MCRIISFAVICLLLMYCNSGAKKTTGPVIGADTIKTTPVIKADLSDLLEVLQGQWISATDEYYMIEFAGDTLRHINNGKLTESTTVEIDATCISSICGALDTRESWCFIEKGNGNSQCNYVIKCDSTILEYSAFGAANPSLNFRKLK